MDHRNPHDPVDPLERDATTGASGRTPLLDAIECPADIKKLMRTQLVPLAAEVRDDLVHAVARTGGHLGAGLGVVELTVALHYVLDAPRDKLVWDVSHQCYPHKILTGRRHRFGRLRQGGGLSGFTARRESAYDPFGAAHSSTAISAGLGLATARDLKGEDFTVVSVVGDGAISGGMAFEGMNNAGAERRRLVVVLNDNDMSIAPPSGALAETLRRLRVRMPSAEARRAALAREPLPSFAGARTLFEDLGLHYAGPFDGHDVDEMVEVLSRAKAWDGPVLLHVLTEKGYGYPPAMAAADRLHATAKFEPATGVQAKGPKGPPNFTSVFATALIEAAQHDPAIVAVTAAMPSGTGLDAFGKAFPDRCFDVGIAEQHAVTFCAGLACEGLKPFAAIYSTFLQRGYDQVVHDVAIQRLPVRFAIDRAGLVGADGVTHQGTYDIAYLGCLPGFVLMAAADETELVRMVATAVAIDDRPSAFRYPRGEGVGLPLPVRPQPLEIGRGRIIREGSTIAILSYGSRLGAALDVADQLARAGISITVADARFAKPIDDRLVRTLAQEHEVLVTLEEGSLGGFSTLVLDSLSRQRRSDLVARLVPIHLPDVFIDHDTPAAQAERAGLNAPAIAARILGELLARDLAHAPFVARAAE